MRNKFEQLTDLFFEYENEDEFEQEARKLFSTDKEYQEAIQDFTNAFLTLAKPKTDRQEKPI